MHHNLLLNKLPILDATKTLFAYQLNVTPLKNRELSADQWQKEILALWKDVEDNVGIAHLTSGKPVFYQAPRELMHVDYLPPLENKNDLYVEVDIQILRDRDSLMAIKEMIKQGVRIALKDYEPNDENDKLLALAKLVKLNCDGSNPVLMNQVLEKLHSRNLQVIMTQVESEERFEDLKIRGVDYFQGYFFTNPVLSSKQEIPSNRLTLLKLLGEVNNPDIEFEALARTIGADVTLTHKLLSAINHPQNNLPYLVESLKDAVSLMGLKRLKFWVNMLMLSKVENVPLELVVTALVRAKFLESVADAIHQAEQKDRFFMVGLFSTLNAFLQVPMVDIVDELPLSDEVKEALTNQKGLMGRALFMTRALEQGNISVLMAGFEGMDIMAISSDYLSADGWAKTTINNLNKAA